MKASLRKLFMPILAMFEAQEGSYEYNPSHRLILKIVGTLFFILSVASLVACILVAQLAALLPVIVFFCIATVCMVVGFLGTDKAVAKIWNSRS